MTEQLITTLEDLRMSLELAVKVEHTTIPPYLCAMYTLHPGTNLGAHDIIRSVAMEEMLHMTLAANVLNAVGGHPDIESLKAVPTYPTQLPFNETFDINLARFCPSTIETFLKIESPVATPTPMPLEECRRFSCKMLPKRLQGIYEQMRPKSETIGQFYEHIQEGLAYLVETLGPEAVFTGGPETQIQPGTYYYGGGGRAIVVYDLITANEAIEMIKNQGEGVDATTIGDGDYAIYCEDWEPAHFYRFNQILKGCYYQMGDTVTSGPTGPTFKVDWDAVYPMIDNPKTAGYPEGSPLREHSLAFNAIYQGLLDVLHEAYNGQPEALEPGVALMYDLKYKAQALIKNPIGDGEHNAGPEFGPLDLA